MKARLYSRTKGGYEHSVLIPLGKVGDYSIFHSAILNEDGVYVPKQHESALYPFLTEKAKALPYLDVPFRIPALPDVVEFSTSDELRDAGVPFFSRLSDGNEVGLDPFVEEPVRLMSFGHFYIPQMGERLDEQQTLLCMAGQKLGANGKTYTRLSNGFWADEKGSLEVQIEGGLA